MNKKTQKIIFIFLLIFAGLILLRHFQLQMIKKNDPLVKAKTNRIDEVNQKIRILDDGSGICYSNAYEAYKISRIFECVQSGHDRDCQLKDLKKESLDSIVASLDRTIKSCKSK